MLDLALDLVDAGDIEFGVLALGPDRLGGLLRHDAELRKRVGRVGFDLEPDTEARLRFPDRGHIWAGVTGDHGQPRRIARTKKSVTPAKGRVKQFGPHPCMGFGLSRGEAWL